MQFDLALMRNSVFRHRHWPANDGELARDAMRPPRWGDLNAIWSISAESANSVPSCDQPDARQERGRVDGRDWLGDLAFEEADLRAGLKDGGQVLGAFIVARSEDEFVV